MTTPNAPSSLEAHRPTTPTFHSELSPTSPESRRKKLLKSQSDAKEKRASASFFKRRSHLNDDPRRDSGMAPSLATVATTSESLNETIPERPLTAATHQDVPAIVIQTEDGTNHHAGDPRDSTSLAVANGPSSNSSDGASNNAAPRLDEPFEGLANLNIETGDFDDPFQTAEISFSKRGSMLLSGKRLSAFLSRRKSGGHFAQSSMETTNNVSPQPELAPSIINADDRRVSIRVRCMYEGGDPYASSGRHPAEDEPDQSKPSTSSDSLSYRPETQDSNLSQIKGQDSNDILRQTLSKRSSIIRNREPYELAGGIEDWKDVASTDVDRFGFIITRRPNSVLGSRTSSIVSGSVPGSPEPAPRSLRNRGQEALATVDESSAANVSPRSTRKISHRASKIGPRSPSQRNSPSVRSHASKKSSITSGPFRRNPSHNNGRRWADEASDMLGPDLFVGPSDADQALDTPARRALERRREEKWAKMARPAASSMSALANGHTNEKMPRVKAVVGGGQILHFDATEPKLVSRTWKGIPDRWRSSAWYSFLLTSAQQSPNFMPDSFLIESFHQLQERDCADDGQIDMDVPRTISSHIMFRRRYRGGQRLLFRVLRALAMYFPDIGYTQGMAPLVATLLCYYDEERAFVMAVRMWLHRGVAELYRSGFQGLMDALDAFDSKGWLGGVANGKVKSTLEQLGVATSAYGTKWYLTLFSYSMPFAAQVRVWDVFMLLGGQEHMSAPPNVKAGRLDRMANFDILHAVSAALLDGLQDQLIDAEFENAMKLLTTSVPVGREDVLLKISKKEYQFRKSRR